jgi:hypothetical protein
MLFCAKAKKIMPIFRIVTIKICYYTYYDINDVLIIVLTLICSNLSIYKVDYWLIVVIETPI